MQFLYSNFCPLPGLGSNQQASVPRHAAPGQRRAPPTVKQQKILQVALSMVGELALPCPGARVRAQSVDQRMRKKSGTMEARGTARRPGLYSLGGAGPGVDVGAGATSSVLSQFSCARGPCPGAGPGVVV